MDLVRTRRLALDMLARREHSRRELQVKLARKGCPERLTLEVLTDLETTHTISDERFAESVVRVRRGRGYGPLHISKELKDKGVDPDIIEHCLNPADPAWAEIGRRARSKKFSERGPKDYKERARQARFLQYRGFTFGQIQSILNFDEPD